MNRLLPIVIAVAALSGCRGNAASAPVQPATTPAAPASAAAPSQPAGAAVVSSPHLDRAKAEHATVVLRVQHLEALGGSKYHWDRVQPLQVLKNASDESFERPLEVAHYGWNKGVPRGTSTIYLERYGDAVRHWRLLGSDGALGVSHVQRE